MKLYICKCSGENFDEYDMHNRLDLGAIFEMDDVNIKLYNDFADSLPFGECVPNCCDRVKVCNLDEDGLKNTADLFVNTENEEMAKELFEDFLEYWNGNPYGVDEDFEDEE